MMPTQEQLHSVSMPRSPHPDQDTTYNVDKVFQEFKYHIHKDGYTPEDVRELLLNRDEAIHERVHFFALFQGVVFERLAYSYLYGKNVPLGNRVISPEHTGMIFTVLKSQMDGRQSTPDGIVIARNEDKVQVRSFIEYTTNLSNPQKVMKEAQFINALTSGNGKRQFSQALRQFLPNGWRDDPISFASNFQLTYVTPSNIEVPSGVLQEPIPIMKEEVSNLTKLAIAEYFNFSVDPGTGRYMEGLAPRALPPYKDSYSTAA